MVRLCGASLGLFAFSVAIIQGLMVENPGDVILVRAMWALFLFCGLGLIVGWVANRILDEHAQTRYRELFPESEAAEKSSAAPAEPAAGTQAATPRNDGASAADQPVTMQG